MQFLLVAPSSGTPDVPNLMRNRGGSGSSHTQLDHNMRLLVHDAVELDDRLEVSVGDVTCRALDARVHSALGQEVLVVKAELLHADGTARARDRIEEALSTLAVRIAQRSGRPALAEVRWVGRHHLAESPDDEIPGWLSTTTLTTPLGAGPDGPAVVVGWANGRIVGWDALTAGERWDLVSAYVDAQVLWCQLEDASLATFEGMRQIFVDPDGASLAEMATLLSELDVRNQIHNLCFGEFLRQTQGSRRDIVLNLLGVWRYEELQERTAASIAAGRTHVDGLQQARNSRYQRAVESVLLALTLVSALGLILAFIDLAFLGQPDPLGDRPGGTLPLLEWVRSVDPDDLLLISVLGILAVCGALLATRWPQRKRPRA